MAFLAAAAPIIAVAGTAISAGSSVLNGMYAGQVADNNAKVAGQNAEYTLEAGGREAGISSLRGTEEGARIKTAQSAHGVEVNSGSASIVRASEAGKNELDLETILNNAELRAYGYRTQQTNLEAQGQQDRIGGVLEGIGTLAEAAPSLNMKWGSGGKGNSWSRARADVLG